MGVDLGGGGGELMRRGVDIVCSTYIHLSLSHSQCIQADCPVSYLNTLIVAGARINEADRQGQTPLHSAAERGNDDVTTLLLDNGADLEAVEKVNVLV